MYIIYNARSHLAFSPSRANPPEDQFYNVLAHPFVFSRTAVVEAMLTALFLSFSYIGSCLSLPPSVHSSLRKKQHMAFIKNTDLTAELMLLKVYSNQAKVPQSP